MTDKGGRWSLITDPDEAHVSQKEKFALFQYWRHNKFSGEFKRERRTMVNNPIVFNNSSRMLF